MRSISCLTHRARLTVIVGLSVFLVLAGSGVATAMWTSSASVTGSVTAATTSMTIGGAKPLDTQYAFAGDASHSPTIVRTMMIKNTGTAPLGYTLSISGVAGNALAPLVKLTLWTTTGACATTAGTGATTGTLASPPALPSDALSAAPGNSFGLCASTSLNSTIVASQGLSVTPTLTIIGTVGTSTWNTDTSDAPFTQTVYKMSDPTSLTCTQAKKAQSVTLSWTAPVNYGSTGNLSYQVVDTSGKLIPSQPGTQTTVSIGSSDVSNTMQTFFVQAKEDLYGSTSTGISITLTQNSQGNSGKISCP
jgi:hypothetical protein